MQNIDKCYYINLDHRTDRRSNIERQIQETNFAKKIYRYKAVEGAFVNAEKIEENLLNKNAINDLSLDTCKVWGLSLTQGALGLILTHINIYNEIILTNKNFLIIEDDVRIDQEINAELEKILIELPNNFDICYLGWCDTPFDKKYFSENLSIPFGQLSCTPALIISPSGAAKLKSFIKNIDHQIDTFLYSNFHKLNVFISNKKLFMADSFFDSDIQGNKNMEKKYKNLSSFEDVEIHSLMCHKDILYATNCIKSLVRYEEFSKMPIFIHDDGSLTGEDKNVLLSVSDKIIIIDRSYADSQIFNFIKDKPNCVNYRIKESHINLWHKIKLFDYYYFSKTKKILGLDSDLLFLRRAEDVIKHISNGTGFYFPDNQSAYSFNEPKDEIKTLEKVNTGLIYLPNADNYSLDLIESALSNLIKNGINYFPSWIEQSAFAHMFYELGGFASLNPEVYRIPYFQSIDHSTAECLHFVSYPPVRENYGEFVALSGLEETEFIFNYNFYTEYNEKKIPASLTFNKAKGYYLVEFTWNIKDVGIQCLDHSFIIKNDGIETEYKFQSEQRGFFIIQKLQNDTEISHTYDWYGQKDWKKLNLNYE
jgi:GR25 family glycosyltransferase involved in LPS biosynthesis